MHELMEKLKPICEMKEKLTKYCETELSKSMECVDTKELGEAIDMVKDLAETEEKCFKACYYKTIVKAMKEQKEEDEMMNKILSNPAFCEYMMDRDPDMLEEMSEFGERMGYPRGRSQSGRNTTRSQSSGRYMSPTDGRRSGRMGYGYGLDEMKMREIMDEYWGRMDNDMLRREERPYNKYKDAKRHYTETHSAKDKEEMDMAAGEHMAETVASIKEIWRNADPDMKKRLKQDMASLMNEMNAG